MNLNLLKKLLLSFLTIWMVSSPVLAASLSKARDAFSAGDYKKAKKLAVKAAKKAKKKSQKAEALVIAGAASMKLGKSGKAKFRKALKLDPDVLLPAEAVGDKKIAKVFAALQKRASVAELKKSAAEEDTSSGSRSSGDRESRRAKLRAAKQGKKPGGISSFLPLGINSFVQGKTLSGVAYGGMQVAGIFLYLNRTQAAATANKDADEVIANAEANGAEDDPKFTQFLEENDAFVKKANSEAKLALGLVAVGYSLSVIDSLFDPFGTLKSASLDLPQMEDGKETKYASRNSDFEERRIDHSWKFDLKVMPSREPGLMLTARTKF